ncbi:MAG: bifunctional nuclease family protein [Planctomycetes bacterium]|nr:bifunctional nuclease family protein [Planctomycetota bacterium]
MTMVPFTLARIILSDTHPAQRIILKEVSGERHFTIDIGEPEAVAIYRRAMKRYHPRPLTHDLLDNVIAGMGGTVKTVEITDLKDHTYYANLVIETADGEVRVDARPSDAISLLVGGTVDLMVDDERVLKPLYGEEL